VASAGTPAAGTLESMSPSTAPADESTDSTVSPSCPRHDRAPGEGWATLAMLLTMVVVGAGLALLSDLGDGWRFLVMVASGVAAALTTQSLIRRARIHP
jgi:hypothetical protein